MRTPCPVVPSGTVGALDYLRDLMKINTDTNTHNMHLQLDKVRRRIKTLDADAAPPWAKTAPAWNREWLLEAAKALDRAIRVANGKR